MQPSPFDFKLPGNLFFCEAGDILDITVRPIDEDKLPHWLSFDASLMQFKGLAPHNSDENIWLTVRATNMEGQWAETRLGFVYR